MTEQLLWTVVVQAVGGPQLSASGPMDVEAYDKLTVTVPAGATTDVDLGPGGTAMTCLFIKPLVPDPDLTYDVSGADIALDAPAVLLGGAVALAGSPASLTFKNQTATDADIEILVGRDATP